MFSFKPHSSRQIEHPIPTAQNVGSTDCRLMHALRVKCPMVCRRQGIAGARPSQEKPGGIAARRQCSEEVVASAFDGVDALPVALEGPNLQAQLLLPLAT